MKKHRIKPTLLDFNDRLKENAEAHDLMKQTSSKARTEDNKHSFVKNNVASRTFAANTQPKGTQRPASKSAPPTPRCIVCKSVHRIWECRVFKEKSPTQRAKVVAEAKLCFSSLREKHTFRQCPSPRKCSKDGCNSSHNTLHHGAERFYPSKYPSNNNSNSNAGANQSKFSRVQSSSKTTTFSSVSNVKGLLQVTELQLRSSSGKDNTALVLCDTACNNSWVSNDPANRLGLHGTALKLTVKGINTEEFVDTKLVELIVTTRDNQAFEPFKVSPYVKEGLNVGADVINIKVLQETYPHLAVLDQVLHCYGNIEMMLGQDVYHAIRPLEYFAANEKCSPFAVRLPIGWVLSGPLPLSSGFVSTFFKAIMEQEFELASQVKSWYDMESHGALKQVDPRSASDERAHDILENTIVHNGKRYDVGMPWAEDNIELPNNYFSALVQLKFFEKRLTKDQTLREKYSNTIKEYLDKGYVVRVKGCS